MNAKHDALAVFIISVVIDARRSKVTPENTQIMSYLSVACDQETTASGVGIFHISGCPSCSVQMERTLKMVGSLLRRDGVTKQKIHDTTLEVAKAIYNGAGNREIIAMSFEPWFGPTQQSLIEHVTTCPDCARQFSVNRCSPQRSAEYVDGREEGMSLWPAIEL